MAADWFPAYAYGEQYAYEQYEEGYGYAEDEAQAVSEDEGVCEALLALGAAADALEESFRWVVALGWDMWGGHPEQAVAAAV